MLLRSELNESRLRKLFDPKYITLIITEKVEFPTYGL